jgi:sugar porter (SP) family MFS transporter
MTQLGNRYGRRKSLMIAATVAAVGNLLECTAFGLPQLTVGRIISGIGNGGCNVAVPVWQSESTKPKNRGRNVMFIGFFIATGIAIISWINLGLSFISHQEVAWRLPLALPILFPIIILSVTMSFPESPRWLLMKGRKEEAREVLALLAGSHADPEVLDQEVEILANIIQQQAESERGFRDLFTFGRDRLFYRLCLAITVNFYAQMSGNNIITFFGPTLFRDSLQLEATTASILTASTLTFKIVTALAAALVVDRFGRRPLFITCTAGMGISMVVLAGSVYVIENKTNTFAASIVATLFTFAFVGFFPLGFLSTNVLYSAEIAPQDLRIYMSGCGVTSHWVFSFLSAQITPVGFDAIEWKFYFVWASICLSGVPIFYFLFPETKNRSLEEMDTIFGGPEHWWQVPPSSLHLETSTLTQLENEETLKPTDKVEHLEKT